MKLPEPQSVRKCPNGKLELTYEELVGRHGQTFVFLDSVFTYPERDDPLRGAGASSMVPVSEEEYERRLDEMRDYEYSPLARIYDEQSTPKGWDEWIEGQLRHDARDLILDESYVCKYGDDVREHAHLAGYDVEPEYVECVGGGRAFNDAEKDYDTVFNEDLLGVMKRAEADEAPEFWQQVRHLAADA